MKIFIQKNPFYPRLLDWRSCQWRYNLDWQFRMRQEVYNKLHLDNFLNGSVLNVGSGQPPQWELPIQPKYRFDWDPPLGLSAPLPSEPFDAIVAIEVFEHVLELESLWHFLIDHLKPGGIFIWSTPFLARYHPAKRDYYRLLPDFWFEFLNQFNSKGFLRNLFVYGNLPMVISQKCLYQAFIKKGFQKFFWALAGAASWILARISLYGDGTIYVYQNESSSNLSNSRNLKEGSHSKGQWKLQKINHKEFHDREDFYNQLPDFFLGTVGVWQKHS